MFLVFTFGCSLNHKEVEKHSKIPDITGQTFQNIRIKIENNPNLIISLPEDFFNKNYTFSRKLSRTDIDIIKIGINFLENLTGSKHEINFDNVYWSEDLIKTGYLGMTVWREPRESWNCYIAIASELKVSNINNLNSLRDLASVILHEFDHASNLSPEPITLAKIDNVVNISFDYAFHFGLEELIILYNLNTNNFLYSNLLEKIAYESGIKPPWIYYHDFGHNINTPALPLFLIQPPIQQ